MASVVHALTEDRNNRSQLLDSGIDLSAKLLAQTLDATLLSAATTTTDIKNLLETAIRLRVRAVCVAPCYLAQVAEHLPRDSQIRVATVANFPLGNSSAASALFEIEDALNLGANEIDFVQPIGAVKGGQWPIVEQLSKSIQMLCANAVTKVILETALLTDDEITRCVAIHAAAGVNIIKTSTGFAPAGATVAHIERIRSCLTGLGLHDRIGIKASGGVADRQFAIDLIRAGATRIGTSRPQQILDPELSK
jgi:deoxyribose-phosphate aldolase